MSRFLQILVAATICVSSSFAQSPSAKQVSAFEQEVIDQEKHFLQAESTKDSAAVEAAVADDFRGIGTNGDFYYRGELVELSPSAEVRTPHAYDFQAVKLNDESAVVAYNLIVPGEHPRYRHMADTWAKVNNQWKLKFRQITPNLWSANDLD